MHLCTPVPSEMLAFELNADNTLEGLSPSLVRRTRRPWFSTRMSNLDSSDHRTLFHFETVYFKWALAHNERIMPMSDAVSSEGPKTTGIQQRSSALSLTHRDFSSFSDSFDDVMHCRWWDLQSLCNLTLRNVVFKVFHNLFTHTFTDWRAHCPSLFLRDSASLRHPFYS